MITLDRSLLGVQDKIKVPWPALSELIQPGPGHLMVVLGAPGVGKSALSLLWAIRSSSPAVIVSLDTDLATQAQRTVAAIAGIAMSQVQGELEVWQAFLRNSLKSLPMVLDQPIYAQQVGGLVAAAEEFYGVVPPLVIVDVLKDVIKDEGYEGHREALRELHRVARRQGTCIMVLHHINRGSRAGNGDSPPSLASGQYAGEQDAEIVLGLWNKRNELSGMDDMVISVLKNRFGQKDPTGWRVKVELPMDLDLMKIG